MGGTLAGMRPTRALLVGVVLLVIATACVRSSAEAVPTVVVGVGGTAEQRVLAALTVVALEDAGMRATLVDQGLNGTLDLRSAARRGDIDLFWDYTGAAWALGLRQEAPPSAPQESYERVAQEDARRNDFIWLDPPTKANATLAFFVRSTRELPPPEGRTLSWLAGRSAAPDFSFCADPDFIEREGGLEALAAAYSINFEQVVKRPAPEKQAIEDVAAGRCFAGLGTATSGIARNANLVPLTDDLMVFPAFVVGPVVREAVLEETPGLRDALDGVALLLDTTEDLALLNAAVEAGGDPRTVAQQALHPRLDDRTPGA